VRPDFKALRAQQVLKVQLDQRVRQVLQERREVRDPLDQLAQKGLPARQDRVAQKVLKALWVPLDPKALLVWLVRQEKMVPRARRVLRVLLAPPVPKVLKVNREEQDRREFKALVGRLASLGLRVPQELLGLPALKAWLGRQERLARRVRRVLLRSRTPSS